MRKFMLLQQSCIPINIKKILQQTILTESLLWKKIAWKLFYYFFLWNKTIEPCNFRCSSLFQCTHHTSEEIFNKILKEWITLIKITDVS